jgi:uncharacterized protein involved in exopolysaccharide biosynthesis
MEIVHYSPGMDDFIAIAHRRRWHFILPLALILSIATALAFLLPPMYRSQATILIERQSIPADLVKTTVTGYLQEQIEVIRQKIATYENLMQIANAFDLYPEIRQVDPGQAVDRIRKSIEIDMVDVKASKPDARGDSVVTIAFTVSFQAESPEVAQAVTKQLAERYLEENRATRNRRAAEVSGFLTREANALQEEIAKQEIALANFKQQHLEELPELLSMNLKLYEKTEEDIERSREEIRKLKERANALEAELSLTSPFKDIITEEGKRVVSAGDRLSELTAQYLRDSARYSSEHPNIIRMRHEINLLAGQSGSGARLDELLKELVTLQEQLAQARQRYSPTHPTVTKLSRAVAAVEKGLRSTLISPAVAASRAIPPDNPRYVALETQLSATHSDLRAEQERSVLLQQKLQEYEQRLFRTPLAERDFKSLSRDYTNNLKKFGELKEKQMQARMAEQLEAGENAERFVLADAARLPSSPDSPNRLGILLLGGFFALLGGVGSMGAAEFMDRTVRGQRGVAALLGAPPLAVIPTIEEFKGSYELVFRGDILEGFDRDKVKAEFGRIFKLAAVRIQEVFSHPHVVLQKNLSFAQALRYQAAVARLGLKTFLRPMSERQLPNSRAAVILMLLTAGGVFAPATFSGAASPIASVVALEFSHG